MVLRRHDEGQEITDLNRSERVRGNLRIDLSIHRGKRAEHVSVTTQNDILLMFFSDMDQAGLYDSFVHQTGSHFVSILKQVITI